MNSLLELKGKFEQMDSENEPGHPNLPSGKSVKVYRLESLLKNLTDLRDYWKNQHILNGAIISAHYIKVAAKSNRLKGLLGKGNKTPNSSIVGARFSLDNSPKHIVTHYIQFDILDESIKRLQCCIEILRETFNGEITSNIINKINLKENNSEKINFNPEGIAKTNFLKVIVDAYFVEKFDILIDNVEFNNDAIITLYETDIETQKLLEKIGINILSNRILDKTTILLSPDELKILKSNAPYLISMAVSDISQLTKENFSFVDNNTISIPAPKNEPTIGVIDTPIDKTTYFSEWVDYKQMIDKNIPISQSDYEHGTAVTSIIVDGPAINPDLDDGCGRFKVRHFGVASGNQFNSFTILRQINDIVSQNKDIKVWNLSLGSKHEIHKNFISPEAAILDKIQFENDVIFVISGTNLSEEDTTIKYIGAPADSINAVVVNSVDRKKESATYSRKGPVLSFFIKPDISYYGGDIDELMRVRTSNGESFVKGTSFAAPWIARKLCYLINILGLRRDIAKALLIHSSTGWEKQKHDSFLIGHGVAPIRIEDVVHCPDDEIQFVIQGISEKYDTYTYNIPVPTAKSKYPFITKATLCYFPACSRNQGVDYTNTELDISFGRLKNKSIKPINNNYQNEREHYTWEEDARKLFRKWDNVKHIREIYSDRVRHKKSYETGLWGLSLKTKERLEKKYGENMQFGIVITLKEIDGVNRIDEFVKNAQLRQWLVNRIDVNNRIDIYNIAEENIEFEDNLHNK